MRRGLQPRIELSGTVHAGAPAELGAILADAVDRWTKVIKLAGIKAEWSVLRIQSMR